MPAAAVCITGAERSFGEIGDNIRRAVLHSLGSPDIVWFGVKPPGGDSWATIPKLLPIARVASQQRCYSQLDLNVTVSWMHCDFRGRTGDCRKNALQELCDLQQCNTMIDEFEAERGSSFDGVLRLRADIFWETTVRLPTPPAPRTLYFPRMDSTAGANDHLAWGDREAMRSFFSRIRYASRAAELHAAYGGRDGDSAHPRDGGLAGRTIEHFLVLAMRQDKVRLQPVSEWVYCLHTGQALAQPHLEQQRGCIGRARCRTPCASFSCSTAAKCHCLNASCEAFNRGQAAGVLYGGHGHLNLFGQWGQPNLRGPGRNGFCVDAMHSQRFHACFGGCSATSTPFPQLQRAPCAWPRDQGGRYRHYTASAALPPCMLPTDADDAMISNEEDRAWQLQNGRKCRFVQVPPSTGVRTYGGYFPPFFSKTNSWADGGGVWPYASP